MPSIVIFKVNDSHLGGENSAPQLLQTSAGYIVFDDTVRDKNYSLARELVRWQYRGNTHRVIKGIGVVNRLYELAGDGKSKLDPVRERLINLHDQKQLLFRAVLMDTWYATQARG